MEMDERRKWLLLTLLVAALLVWGLGNTPIIEQYVNQARASGRMADIGMETAGTPIGDQQEAVAAWSQIGRAQDESLLNKIKQEAEKSRITPIDARVDRIWKAIPALNGRELDVEKTYKLALQLPRGTPLTYVYQDVLPAVGLDDLGPLPIYKGNPEKKMISLMINVAWGDEYLPRMLEILKKENVHATFFLDGMWLSKNLEAAKAIGEAGHELSNHAYSHKNMSELSRAKAEQEISKTEKLLEQIGVKNKLFAPPSGDYDQETVEIAHSMKLRTILWTIDTVDWMKPAPEAVLRKVSSRMEPGAMILMHPTSSSMNALEGIIKEAKRRGLALGTVSELISPERVPELETNLSK